MSRWPEQLPLSTGNGTVQCCPNVVWILNSRAIFLCHTQILTLIPIRTTNIQIDTQISYNLQHRKRGRGSRLEKAHRNEEHTFLECVPVFILRGPVWWVEGKKIGSMGW